MECFSWHGRGDANLMVNEGWFLQVAKAFFKGWVYQSSPSMVIVSMLCSMKNITLLVILMASCNAFTNGAGMSHVITTQPP